MGPDQTLRDITGQYYKEMKSRYGLTPFDLFSWEFLLELERETHYAGRHGQINRRSQFKRIRQEIWAALDRKAEDIDMESGESEAQDYLEELKDSRRSAVA